MKKIAIFYGTTLGNTESVAELIAGKLNADVFNVSTKPSDKLSEYDVLIFGTSTWGLGELQDDWAEFIAYLETADLSGKTIAIFGLGDGVSYADNFVDGMGIIYQAVKDKNCKIVGFVDTDGYDFEKSISIIDNKFVGLAIDEENEGNLTSERIDKWVEQLLIDV